MEFAVQRFMVGRVGAMAELHLGPLWNIFGPPAKLLLSPRPNRIWARTQLTLGPGPCRNWAQEQTTFGPQDRITFRTGTKIIHGPRTKTD